MARIVGALPDDTNAARKELTALVNGAARPETQRTAADLVRALRRLEARGAAWAERILDALATDGARKFVQTTLKEDVGTVRVHHNGSVEVPARYAIPVRDEEGGRVTGYQMPLWWEMSWAEYDAMVSRLIQQRDVLSHRVTAFDEVSRVRVLFPDAATPGEACEMAGIDPRSFELVEATA